MKRRQCFGFLAFGVWFFLLGFVLAWQHFQRVRLGYQIEQLKAQRAGLEEWSQQLRLEQASLSDPHRIDFLARQNLGMRLPGHHQVLRVVPAIHEMDGHLEFAHNFPAPGEIFRQE